MTYMFNYIVCEIKDETTKENNKKFALRRRVLNKEKCSSLDDNDEHTMKLIAHRNREVMMCAKKSVTRTSKSLLVL